MEDMHWKSNVRRLKELGVKEESLGKIVKLRWILEYSLPTEALLRRIGHMLSSDFKELSQKLREQILIRDEIGDTMERYKRALFYMFKVYGNNCEASAEQILEENFEELLFVKRQALDHSHLVLVFHSLYSINPVIPLILFELETSAIGVRVEESEINVFNLRKHSEGVLWIEERRDSKVNINLFSGQLVDISEAEKLIESYKLIASRVFSSEKWKSEKVVLKMLESYGETARTKEDVLRASNLLQAERMARVLQKIGGTELNKIGAVPLDFLSYVVILYSTIIDY